MGGRRAQCRRDLQPCWRLRQHERLHGEITRPIIEDAARVAGVSEKTIRRWLQEPQFNARYLQARRDSVHQATARMQQATGAAGTIILKRMTDRNVPPAVRLRAAECVFEHAIKGVELEDFEA
jgi:hypothetical protein